MVVETALRREKRTRTSAAVVAYVHQEIFEGRLRCADRIDVERIGAALDVSPTPVREALLLLEREGVVTARVHRATFVEHFDARTLRADFHVMGLLGGVAAARVAHEGEPQVVARLQELLSQLRAAGGDTGMDTGAGAADHARRNDLTSEIVRVQHQAGTTPRLLAELRGSGGFLEWALLRSDRRTHEEIVAAHAAVIDAIAAGEPRQASRARLADARAAAEEVIGELIRRGVLRADGSNAAVPA
ncbi:GntR family transcriptional regulator [Frankia sp. EI5c]|uniref:GntR family transcriptional regulator n=1 Tax=Frankia sp. EI5c TaxID=683316 RepID=UPI000825DFBD|nr:GntR family transcriptional regulator [Frankia sp. EI5c]